MALYQATTSAPVNIAVIKYWGKRDTKLILPTNSSLSVTLDQDDLKATTTSQTDPSFSKDRLWLNGVEEEIKPGSRLATCFEEMRRLRRKVEQSQGEPAISQWFIHVASFNNFPTAAGLASSAAGFAALVSSIAALYKLPNSPSELSLIARQGSGSACRSLFGGFVAWQAGTATDGLDSYAVEVAPREHWPEISAVICVVSDHKKGTSSTAGMQRTVETSTLLQHRIKEVVPQRMTNITKAIKDRDFDTFARITMADSNSFHAVALDTEPPIFYMNDVSRAIVNLIVEYNRASTAAGGPLKAAYTYDAGPNAVIYALKEHIPEIVNLVSHYFPQAESARSPLGAEPLPAGFNANIIVKHDVGAVKNLILTRVGDGPRVLGAEASLLDKTGLPLSTSSS
ncbi:Diphosphomevalonate decarboxylase [Sistotremastrum niveocremeum HHB9708]|uniref:Diphosphomevalonate decarboxylase n=1 Tax=Sistotremastrum niveocremeum HHB9708 TaxID=1314777 RepID=A0A165A9E6_9AGAM|nr:Diphosphomevalonate decarboxylase [Sistotremastrum niveocremeum HHB9708]